MEIENQSFDKTADTPEVPFATVADSVQVESVKAEAKLAVVDELPPQFQNIAAKGGAVAAVTLGLLTLFGAFVTQWSIFNAVVGIVLGIWGLKSPLKRTAWLGLSLCVAGLVLCFLLYSNP